MSKSGSNRRRSLFGIPSFTHIHEPHDTDPVKQQSSKTLKKRKVPALATSFDTPGLDPTPDDDDDAALSPARSHPSPAPSRPMLAPRTTANRPNSSVFGSLKSLRSTYDDDTPFTTTSSRPPSLNWGEWDGLRPGPKVVLHHGEVQTSSSMFRKKKEYLALTETHILRYKSQSKASESLSA